MISDVQMHLAQGGLTLSTEAAARLERYHALLLDWNTRMDLTNVPPEEMPLRHYADSLLPLMRKDWFPMGTRLVDVGTGAGFPGLMLALAREDMHITLLDAQRKRCDFLQNAVEVLELANVQVIHARAEDAARGPLRETMDAAVARAVAPLNVLCEYLLPFVKVGGWALCWKGPALYNELPDARRAAALLSAQGEEPWRMPISGREHYVQAFRKLCPIARTYPRRSGTPGKQPLGAEPPTQK